MAYEIKKVVFDGIELLPDITETPFWAMADIDRALDYKKSERQLAGLYMAICKRENYFQINSPTAFGNPDYSFLSGVVSGFLQAMDAEEILVDDQIVICKTKTGRKMLILDKLTKPKGYYESLRDNRMALSEMGF